MAPTNIGPFEIITVIGSGPRGTVYRARHVSHGRIVAIKQLSATPAADSPEYQRLWNEIARLRAVVSNHVATTHSVELVDGRPIIEMESLGESLEKTIGTRPLGLRDVLRAVQDVLSGLKVMHDAGIIHANLKTSNVLQDTTTGSWKISDGGTTAIESSTTPTLLVTSVLYVAPETMSRSSETDERSDLYSAGMMGLEAALGSEKLKEAFPRVVNLASPSRWLGWLEDHGEEAVPLNELRPDTPLPVSQFLSKLLSKDPAARFSSAFEALVELEGIVAPMATSRTEMLSRPSVIAETPTLLLRTPEGPAARLQITGPDGFDQQVDLSDRTYRIGREPQNDIVLPDDTKAVSRIHAELKREGGRYILNDLDSQNGLWVNGRRKPSIQLTPGLSVKIGGYTITFSGGAPPAETKGKQTAPPQAKAKPAEAARSAAAALTAAALRVSTAARAFWPPKNIQQWAAFGAAVAVLIVGILWLALPSGTPVSPNGGVATTPTLIETPTPPSTPTARDNSLKQIRELIGKSDFEGAIKEADLLLTVDPQDAEAAALKQEASAALAALTPTPPTTPTTATTPPPTPIAGGTPRTQGGGRPGGRAVQPANTGLTYQPRIPKRANESDADWIARERRLQGLLDKAQATMSTDPKSALGLLQTIQSEEPGFPNLGSHIGAARVHLNNAVQVVVQEGQVAERAGDLPKALKTYERAKELDPNSGQAKAAYDGLRARMTREGEQLFKNAKEDAAVGTFAKLNEAREGFMKAILYLPDDHPMKKQARDALERIK